MFIFAGNFDILKRETIQILGFKGKSCILMIWVHVIDKKF